MRLIVLGVSVTACIAWWVSCAARAETAAPIKIGDISAYSALPAGTRGYRQGWELALDQINGKGGVLGRQIEVISKDDAGKPAQAVTDANELVDADNVELLTGTILSNVGLAVTDYAKQKQIFFLASEPLTDAIIWEHGNHYTFRLRPSTYTQAAILAQQASKFPAKRWATIAPNYEFGQSAVANFKKELKRLRPDVEFVAEQWPPLGKIDAGSVLEAVTAAKPDAILNATFGSDLAQLVREGDMREAFANREVVSIMSGEPEYLAPLKGEAPTGWLVTGYPWDSIDTPAHRAFRDAYIARFKEPPNMGALIGYINMEILAKTIRQAGSTQSEALIRAMEQLSLDTPVGPVGFRAIDHQSTLGVYVGRLALKDGRGTMVDWKYFDGANFQPSDAVVAAARKQ